jgi:SRSO17 transposase
VKSLVTGLPLSLRFRTKGELAIDILTAAYLDGLSLDFVCGDEVYGSCTQLREFLEDRGQGYVLRVASTFTLSLAAGTTMNCADAVRKLLKDRKAWEVRSSGELAFHYCFVPDGQAASKARLIRAAGLRWPVEESFELGKGCFGLDQCQARAYTAILRHFVLVMAALAICAVTAAMLKTGPILQRTPATQAVRSRCRTRGPHDRSSRAAWPWERPWPRGRAILRSHASHH